MVRILLDYNADPYIPDSRSFTPLHNAAESGHVDVIKTLLEYGVDVNRQTDFQKYTALHVAALRGNSSVVECLLNHPGECQADERKNIDAREREFSSSRILTAVYDLSSAAPVS